jgi:hypothetical protein
LSLCGPQVKVLAEKMAGKEEERRRFRPTFRTVTSLPSSVLPSPRIRFPSLVEIAQTYDTQFLQSQGTCGGGDRIRIHDSAGSITVLPSNLQRQDYPVGAQPYNALPTYEIPLLLYWTELLSDLCFTGTRLISAFSTWSCFT